MENKQSSPTLRRLGLCFGGILILSIYADAAASNNLAYYLPLGLLILSAYSWFVVKKLKGIYPIASIAIGQLCITFFVVALSSSIQINQIKRSIEQGSVKNYSTIYPLVRNVVQGQVAGTLSAGLLIAYLISKKKQLHNKKGG